MQDRVRARVGVRVSLSLARRAPTPHLSLSLLTGALILMTTWTPLIVTSLSKATTGYTQLQQVTHSWQARGLRRSVIMSQWSDM